MLVKLLNKIENEPGDCIFAVCKNFILKLTYHLFTNIDKETPSIENEILYTSLKQNAALTWLSGPIYINFDEYPLYTGSIKNIYITNIDAHIKYCHDLPYYSFKVLIMICINKESW